MSRSRKNWNEVNAASLARWIVLTGFLALTGLSYVYLTLQLYHLGDRRKALENEVANLRMQNEVVSAQIAALTSRSTLQQVFIPLDLPSNDQARPVRGSGG